MTHMGTTAQGFDPAALLLILIVVGAGAALGIAALRRRPKVPRWLKLGRSKKRLDVIRRDLDRTVEHIGELRNSEPAVRQPFELGLAQMTACRWDKAIEHFHEAWARASRSQLVPLTIQIGVCHYMQGSLFDALKEFRGTIDLAEREGDKQGRAAALANIGVIHHEYGELGSALTLLNEALAVSRESGNQRVVALCLGNIGNIQRDKGQIDDALKSHEDALAISRRIGDEQGVVSALGNTASVRRDKRELDKALELYAEAVETARRIGDNFGYAVELSGIGGVYRDKGDLGRALKFHEDALAGARRIGFRLGEAAELGNVGLILEKKGAHAQAIANFVETLTILMLVGVSHGQNQALLGLSRCDDALGRERMPELLKQAGASDEGVADLLDRVDQLRLRRPRPRRRN
jgi:tetratricopeptide (TPR) repeat protein